MEEIKLTYTENDFLRIDKYLSNELNDFTRTQLQLMIDEKLVLVNGNIIKSNYKLKINDEITIFIKEPELTDIEPEDIPLDVIYEDKDIIVINKPIIITIKHTKNKILFFIIPPFYNSSIFFLLFVVMYLL